MSVLAWSSRPKEWMRVLTSWTREVLEKDLEKLDQTRSCLVRVWIISHGITLGCAEGVHAAVRLEGTLVNTMLSSKQPVSAHEDSLLRITNHMLSHRSTYLSNINGGYVQVLENNTSILSGARRKLAAAWIIPLLLIHTLTLLNVDNF